MENLYAERIKNVPRSFIREILKISLDPSVISFAGGLPNADYFPVRHIQAATEKVFTDYGSEVLQYSNSEGDLQLREWIAARYKEQKNLIVSPDNIIITNGSQQGIDLLGKVLLNDGDGVLIEEPGYLGAIQSLSLFRPVFIPAPLNDDGLDIEILAEKSGNCTAKMLYSVPTFQNPSGVTYSDENKEQVSAIAEKNSFVIVEDDPYWELRFSGKPSRSFAHFLPQQTAMLGSFSKIVAPGFRLGWIAAPEALSEKLLIAKQAADLHTSSLSQKIMYEYLVGGDLDTHIKAITDAYGGQCRAMQDAIQNSFPKSIQFTRPEGGMFLWGKLPEGMDSMALFDEAVKEKVVFVLGILSIQNRGQQTRFG